jgi:hypothetical protein
MKVTVEYTSDSGLKRVVNYDATAGTAEFEGRTASMKMTGNVVTIDATEGVMTLTLESVGAGPPAVGDTTRYVASNGDKGVARITSVT